MSSNRCGSVHREDLRYADPGPRLLQLCQRLVPRRDDEEHNHCIRRHARYSVARRMACKFTNAAGIAVAEVVMPREKCIRQLARATGHAPSA